MTSTKDERRRVCVCVLGDIGRSPRMQYHSLSLAENNFVVDFLGFKGSKPNERVVTNNSIECHYMKEVPKSDNYLPRLLVYAFKVLWQSIVLFLWLFSLKKANFILVQNPPSIPTLAIVWIVCRIRGSGFIIDWHNYGFTILGLTVGKNHFLVKTCKWFETYFGTKSDFNFCVTNAMKSNLKNEFNISASVLYDRPPDIFAPISLEDKHNLFIKLKSEYNEFSANDSNDENETIFTKRDINGEVILRTKRPALVMSSTSWTEDEDFDLLFEALQKYDIWAEGSERLPQLICVVTGKGPLKQYYRQKILNKKFNSVKVVFPWLTAQDYPKLVASADLGICLHKSSSNLDLPMKVVDMFGCCLPVLAYEYQGMPFIAINPFSPEFKLLFKTTIPHRIHELVKNGKNGLLFTSFEQLAQHLKNIFNNFPEENQTLLSFRNHLKQKFLKNRWNQNWTQNALHVFLE